MKLSTNKTKPVTIALILILAMVISLFALPTASAHDPAWEIPTTAFMSATPNPVGVGQSVFVVVWLDRTLPNAWATNDLRFKNFKLTITAPNGDVDTVVWDIVVDTTSSAYTTFTPDQTGEYTLKFEFPGMTFTWDGDYKNDVYKPSSRTVTLTVQDEQIPDPITSYPLPTEYWTRPIEGQNTDWWKIASNWLGSGDPYLSGYRRKIQPYGAAPNSAHIMWTRSIQDGGVVGGGTNIDGNAFYPGLTYNRRFSPIIMGGRLYYGLPWGNSGSGMGGYMCVDLLTGETIWGPMDWGTSVNEVFPGFFASSTAAPAFGYYFDYEMMNQHGVIGEGWLFTTDFGMAISPSQGKNATLQIINVPSGTAVKDKYGAHIRYVMDYPNRRLASWNSSRVFDDENSGTIDASTPARFDWNVTISDLNGVGNPSIIAANCEDMIFGQSFSFLSSLSPSSWGTPNPCTFWAISTKPESAGQLLWLKNITLPNYADLTYLMGTVDFESRVFTVYEKEGMHWYGFSLDDGRQLWGPTPRPLSDWDYYEPDTTVVSVYGRLYYSCYGGILYCYDVKNGTLLWTYGNGGPGNSTDSGKTVAYGRYPIMPEIVADGKIYLTTTEHSPNTPLFKGSLLRCLDAYTGEELWTISDFGGTYGGFGPQSAIADGYLAILNQYDYQIYCFGKGPSATTVEAPMTAIAEGSSLVIRGTVTDIAAGTTQNEQAARFPHGVAAVSDESMKGWMEYVYMQKPLPSDVTGVDVSLDVLDSNGNFRNIGTATTDATGFYSYAWKPDIPGQYTVYATFAGSDSYYKSYAETSFVVDEAPEPTAPPQYPQPIDPTITIIAMGIVIIIAVAIIGLLLLRKR